MGGLENIEALQSEIIKNDDDNVVPEASEQFVYTSHVRSLTQRAMAYLNVGYSVHFAGAAGTGKTTLAFHLAAESGKAGHFDSRG